MGVYDISFLELILSEMPNVALAALGFCEGMTVPMEV